MRYWGIYKQSRQYVYRARTKERISNISDNEEEDRGIIWRGRGWLNFYPEKDITESPFSKTSVSFAFYEQLIRIFRMDISLF